MRRQQLTETQIADLFDPPTEPRELVRHYTLTETDFAMVRRCREEWEQRGDITDFPLGETDLLERFVVPQKLYGRDAERVALERALARTVGNRVPRVQLVVGPVFGLLRNGESDQPGGSVGRLPRFMYRCVHAAR